MTTPTTDEHGLLPCQLCEDGVCGPCPPSSLHVCAACGATLDTITCRWGASGDPDPEESA